MTRTVLLKEAGEPAPLQIAEVPLGKPGPGEVRLRQSFVGVNFVDVYHCRGLYPLAAYPGALGVEAVGTVEELGDGVEGFAVGDRVAYGGLPAGSYAEARNLPAGRLVKLPEGVSERLVAGNFLRGLTAYLLLEEVTKVRPGQTLLIHAAAGGLGLVLVQWAKRLGATTIGTVGSPEKAAVAKAHGLDHAVLYKQDDFVAAVKDLTAGEGVDYAIEGVGGDTFLRTLEAVRPFGVVANVGQVGEAVPPVAIHRLTNRLVTRPSVLACLADADFYRRAAAAWFAVLGQGLQLSGGHEYPLAEAAAALADMAAGRTTGAVRLRV